MSQRQLAQQSGVDHSTISRLVRGDRMPSLGTATKLARGLRELGENDDGPQYLGLMGGGVQNPTARVEYALRADEALSEAQVRQVMEYYLAVRMRRVGACLQQPGAEPPPARRAGAADHGRCASPTNSPIVPRPALVAGGSRPRCRQPDPMRPIADDPAPPTRPLDGRLLTEHTTTDPEGGLHVPRSRGMTNAGARGAGVRRFRRPAVRRSAVDRLPAHFAAPSCECRAATASGRAAGRSHSSLCSCGRAPSGVAAAGAGAEGAPGRDGEGAGEHRQADHPEDRQARASTRSGASRGGWFGRPR